MEPFEEKRKNDDRRGFPWRSALLLVIGFSLGVIATLIFVPARVETVTYMSGDDFARSEISVVQPAPGQNDFELTATWVVQQATQMAGGVFVAPDTDAQGTPMTDSLLMTATAIIQQATQTAGS